MESKGKDEITIKTTDENTMREIGRLVAGGYYDYQDIRKGAANRLRSTIRFVAEGISADTPEAKKEEKDYLKKYQDKNIPIILQELVNKNKISVDVASYVRDAYELLQESKKLEEKYKHTMTDFVEKEPIWQEFLKYVKGVSYVFAANLLKEVGYCEDGPHASSLWRLAGYHVIDGEAPRRKKGVVLDYNHRLHSLMYLIGDSFIKQRTSPYRDIYDAEKSRQLQMMANELDYYLWDATAKDGKMYLTVTEDDANTIKGMILAIDKTAKIKIGEVKDDVCEMIVKTSIKPNKVVNRVVKINSDGVKYTVAKSRMHADLRARRKMVKRFMQHYWVAARKLKGLSINMPYAIEKLGHDPSHYAPSEFEPKMREKTA